MRFRQYLINEGFLVSLFGKAIKLLKGLFNKILSKLSFGKIATIKIGNILQNINPIVEEKTGSKQALLGFWAEYEAAHQLNKILEDNGFSVRSNTSDLKKTSDEYFINNIKPLNDKSSEMRIRSAGEAYGHSIFKSISEAPDAKLFDYVEVKRTDARGGSSDRADLTIYIKKKNENEVITLIEASLKTTQSGSVTLLNNTETSFITKFVWGLSAEKSNIKEIQKKNKYIYELIVNMKKMFKLAIDAKKDGKLDAKDILRSSPELKKMKTDLSNLFIDEINKKSKDVEFIGRIKDALGIKLNSAEVIYAAIGNKDNVKVLDSQNSKVFNKLVDKFNNGVKVEARKVEGTIGFIIDVYSISGEKIASLKPGISDTGSGSIKMNTMDNVKNVLS